MEHVQFAVRVACTVGEYQGCFYKTPTPPASAPRWTPPPRDMLKFNVDAGGLGSGGTGNTGEVVAARARQLDHAADAFSTELRAVEQVLDLAAELGVVRLTIEMEALLLEQALNRHAPDCSRQA